MDNNYRLGDTKEYILKDYFDILKGKGISKNDVDTHGKYECIRYGELYTKYGDVISDVYSKTNVTESIKSVKGDLILPSSGETAEDMASISAVSKDGILLGGDINILRPKVDEFDYRYLSYNLNTSLRREISTLAQGISVMHIYPSSLEKLRLNIHEYDLQTKIGKLILDIDDSIELFKEQKELLEQKKKHYLNVIFNDKNGGNYRLGERKIYKINDISTIVSDGIHSTPKYDENGSIPFVNGNNIKSYTIDTTNVEKYINKEEYNKYKKTYNDKSVVIALNGSIGRVGINTPSEKLFGKSIGYINCCEDIILPKYMMYYLDTNSIQNKFISSSTGSTIKNLSIAEIKNIKLNIHSINKQKEIESFMFNLDSQISNYTKQKELLEQKKKHYLNIIFNDKIK